MRFIDIKLRIPEQFISQYESDKFEDSLQRILADIRDSEELVLSGRYEMETIEMLLESLKESIITGRGGVINISRRLATGKERKMNIVDFLNGYTDEGVTIADVIEQPKTGHWIIKSKTSAVCSCCHKNNLFYGDFCKWCGEKND